MSDYELPPLPEHWEHGVTEFVRSWGRAAIEADRKRRGESQQPFGYFRPEPFGWTDCAATDEGAIALYERPQVRGEPVELQGVSEALSNGDGFWRSCTGCHETNEGHATVPYSETLQCHLGIGCSECGGIGAIWDDTDYEAMADYLERDMGAPQLADPTTSNSTELEEAAKPVGLVRHFQYSGIARNGFRQEATLNDDAPDLPEGTPLYAAPQPAEPVKSHLKVSYDDKGDCLYVVCDSNEPADAEEDDKGILYRRAISDGRLVGVTIMNFMGRHAESSTDAQRPAEPVKVPSEDGGEP